MAAMTTPRVVKLRVRSRALTLLRESRMIEDHPQNRSLFEVTRGKSRFSRILVQMQHSSIERSYAVAVFLRC